ncbi:hypothetical protein GCM10007389_21620 [Pontibacter akesuensis]|nr:hypothetical protein GCM10007389_21620 [Pontibacter akesuensis]
MTSCQDQASSNQAATDTTAAVQTPEPQSLDSTYLIIPGEGIGKVNVGMPGEELTAALGDPDSTDAAMGKALLYWLSEDTAQPRHFLAIYTESDFGSDHPQPIVKQLQVTSPQFKTPDNISTGTSLSEIREHYPHLEPLAYYQNGAQQQVYIFDAQPEGIAFEVTLPDSILTAITVHEKGKDVSGNYLPLHPGMTLLKQP